MDFATVISSQMPTSFSSYLQLYPFAVRCVFNSQISHHAKPRGTLNAVTPCMCTCMANLQICHLHVLFWRTYILVHQVMHCSIYSSPKTTLTLSSVVRLSEYTHTSAPCQMQNRSQLVMSPQVRVLDFIL